MGSLLLPAAPPLLPVYRPPQLPADGQYRGTPGLGPGSSTGDSLCLAGHRSLGLLCYNYSPLLLTGVNTCGLQFRYEDTEDESQEQDVEEANVNTSTEGRECDRNIPQEILAKLYLDEVKFVSVTGR